jgi:U32 family peptidase
MDNIEVLSPAGDKERLLAAIEYGSDAVYLGRKNFGMRSSPSNFDLEGLKDAVELAHKNNVKVYLTCNTLPRNNEIPEFQQFVEEAVECKVDALIAADIGILSLIKKYAPNIEVHASTQTGIVNYVTANELYNMGCKRVVLARELSLEEIAEIRAKTPKQMDIEAFVHGAMCVSFSGRCLLSSYLVNRDANRGECAQPCRWGYHLMEEKRTEDFFPIFEDEQGTYILNSKDLCMINYIDKVIEAGVSSLKIEGRAKSAYYVSIITNAYKMAVDHYKKNTNNFSLPTWISEEVYKVSHRKYCTGFFFGHPNDSQYYETGGYIRGYDVVGVVDKCENGYIYATQRNKFLKGTTLEIISPKQQPKKIVATEIFNEKGESVESANHAMMKFSIPSQENFPQNAIIRMEK